VGSVALNSKRGRIAVSAALVMMFAVAGGGVTVARTTRTPQTHQLMNSVAGVLTTNSDSAFVATSFKNPKGLICSTSPPDANVNTDCEGTAPHNETSIAINPTGGSNLIGSANDYQLRLSPGGTVYETVYSRAHVTFDGGTTWDTYPIDFSGYDSTGDPGVAFDADGTAYLSTLGFVASQGSLALARGSVLVAHSGDGGVTWSKPSLVAAGTGSLHSVGVAADKAYITAWDSGNAIATWTNFQFGIRGSYIRSPIYDSVTHDGGKTWSKPAEISGSSASFCTGATGGTKCDQSQWSIPTVASDGSTIYVGFLNYDPTGNTTGRDQQLIVQVDPATGLRTAGPYRIGTVWDGFTDYPINIDSRETYQDSEFRTFATGNFVADPTNPSHLAAIWSDMRNSTLPVDPDPYSGDTTNSDIIVSQSTDGGVIWSASAAITPAKDQFMPWGAYDSTGHLRIGFFDRSYDGSNHEYGYTLATETTPGNLTFTFTQVTTSLSDPTQGDRWFSGRTPNPDFPNPTTFLGDYSNIAATTGVASFWTDMRNAVTFTTRTGWGEDAYYATSP
jgi:hypothetical protein